MALLPRPSCCVLLAAVAAVFAPVGVPRAGAVDAGPALFIVPVPLAPRFLQGEFPVTVASGETVLDGILALSLDAAGGLTGSLDVEGESFAVTGTQSFRNGKGSVTLAGSGATGTFAWKGKIAGGVLAGKSKASGTFLPAKGTFAVDISEADPLTAYLDLHADLPATGPVSGDGTAAVAGTSTPLEVSGVLGKGIAIAATGTGISWSAKGKASPLGGWVVSWKAEGRGCKSAGKGAPFSPVTVDLIAGATPFAGPYPEAALVALPAPRDPCMAIPGQAIVFFDATVSTSSAASVVTGAGGTVIGSIPAIGYYLVSVAPGGEADFLTAIEGDAGVLKACPHVASAYGGSLAAIIDECKGPGSHGSDVRKVFEFAGGHDGFCLYDGDDNPASDGANLDLTLDRLTHYIRFAHGGPLLVNISSYGPGKEGWYEFMNVLLTGVAALPEEERDRLALTICAGNENREIATGLARLRADPRLADVLSRNVILASASNTVYAGANDAPGDADVLLLPDATSLRGGIGTSFAAPRALAILQKLVDKLGVSPTFALKSAKEAAKRNAGHLLDYDEALAVAYEFLGTAPAGVMPASFAFEAIVDGPAPPTQSFTIRNLAGVGKSLVFNVTGTGQWLSLDTTHGAIPVHSGVILSVKADPSGLAEGTYEKTFALRGPKGITYAEIPVTLVVLPPPVYSGDFAANMGSHTTFAGCTFGLDLAGTLNLRPREGNAGAVLGDGDTDADLGVFVTYAPAYTYCTASPFTEHRTGTISGTKENLVISLASGAGFTMDFTGTWSGDTITGSATWNQRYLADGDYVYKTGTIPSLILTKQP